MVDPTNAHELAAIAGEIGADVISGVLPYPSETGGWLVGDVDFCEYFDRYRNQEIIVIIAPVGNAPGHTYTCGICGFVYDEYGECPRCRLASEQAVLGASADGQGQGILDQVRLLLRKQECDDPTMGDTLSATE